MSHGRAYVMKTTPPIPDNDRDAARRLVARRIADDAERAEVEDMLGLTVFPPSSQAGLASVRVRIA